MSRNKRHKIKNEMPESSTSQRQFEEHDLAYYIHDRVELMHQVFSVLKYKELKAMAPACVRNISIDDLQELCTEELLGISSKRLCAILDGAEPPSDTESSSQSAAEQLETISLDSISSDEEILSQTDRSKKKKHKHRRHSSRSKRKKSKDSDNEEEADKSKASRAGLTVLELLELQARARAIRAQLQQEQAKITEPVLTKTTQSAQSSEDEVEIKEEPAEVVEISSDEEKPKIKDLEAYNSQLKPHEEKSKTVTKRINDLVITVPQQKTQKIKLNRTKSAHNTNNTENNDTKKDSNTDKTNKHIGNIDKKDQQKEKSKDIISKKDKGKKKRKKRLSNTSDNDEITLQLSDTEKMDLLGDLERKSYENHTSDSKSDSESDTNVAKKPTSKETGTSKTNSSDKTQSKEIRKLKDSNQKAGNVEIQEKSRSNENKDNINVLEKDLHTETSNIEFQSTKTIINDRADNDLADSQSNLAIDLEIVASEKKDFETKETGRTEGQKDETADKATDNIHIDKEISSKDIEITITQNNIEESKSASNLDYDQAITVPLQDTSLPMSKCDKKQMSEGELSDRESSEIEAYDLKPEVVYISDEEAGKTRKKKKKKEKKSKKEKKNKNKDREVNDQKHNKIDDNATGSQELSCMPVDTDTANKDSSHIPSEDVQKEHTDKPTPTAEDDKKSQKHKSSPVVDQNQSDIGEDSPGEVIEISDEIYILSDDSSNEDETETKGVLSKEPTASEIEALSAKIDEIERVEVITEEEIREYETMKLNEEAMSWKERYLDSKKVKKVLNTSNILNVLRKKNKQLKMRLKESKAESQEESKDGQEGNKEAEVSKDTAIAEGSIEQYNTLQGSTKFVDPVKEAPINDTLKKDAKQLLKMYKKLLKYNDINRKRDPNKKKKKKKSKKIKEKDSIEDSASQQT